MRFRTILAFILLLSVQQRGAYSENDRLRTVTTPPRSLVHALNLNSFYRQYVNDDGFPILASEKVSPIALREAAYIVDKMLANRKDLRQTIILAKVRCVVMGVGERTTDVPEHGDLAPKEYWDRRARGLGATKERPVISCAEENLLDYPGDPYRGENILVHEFAHVIHEIGMAAVDPGFDARLKRVYDAAMEKGLWKGTYAATNYHEYWANGAQAWFDCSRTKAGPSHNGVATRSQLEAYDPELDKLFTEVFRGNDWRYKPVKERMSEAHLKGYNPAQAPTFSWDGKKNPTSASPVHP